MVALSLIEAGMPPEDAVLFIRERRKGAINSRCVFVSLCVCVCLCVSVCVSLSPHKYM